MTGPPHTTLGGFMTFIPLAFHPDNTDMADLPGTTGMLDLRNIAVPRLIPV